MRDSTILTSIVLIALSAPLRSETNPNQRLQSELRDPSGLVADAPTEVIRTVLEGLVLDAGGRPAEGAVVISSAGGRAVVAADGAFRFEVELPLEAREVQVTAFRGSGIAAAVGSARVALLHAGGATYAGTLVLQQGVGCQPEWLPTFGSFPGVSDRVEALAVFDDGAGGGPALFLGGTFRSAGGLWVERIAKWDGTTWSPLGSGMDFTVSALTVFDDGSGGGPALCAGGGFTTAGGVSANRIAKWDGTSWSSLGSGMNGFNVYALAVFDDGSGGGSALYAGGDFTTAGGVSANRIAKWDGTNWSPLASGMNDVVVALAVFDDGAGSGPALYAGGAFTTAGGTAARRIARWDGTSWSGLGSGMNSFVIALTVFDDGSGGGDALYAGGDFTSAGGVPAVRIAKWNGASWTSLGSGFDIAVWVLGVFDDGGGGGPALYAGGPFTTAGGMAASRIAKWDGASWSPLGSGASASVGALATFDDGGGSGATLYVGGEFMTAGGLGAHRIATWDGASWETLGSGVNNVVSALATFDDGGGGGPELYAGGDFTGASGVAVSYVARWDGTSWSPLGTGVSSSVRALTVFDDGGGGAPALYAAGQFTSAGGASANRIAKWDGASWSPLGSGIDNTVHALAVFDDGSGSGPELYAGGTFAMAGGVAATRIARWDGASWSAVGGGMSFGSVFALTVVDQGSGGGTVLCAGGTFTGAGGQTAQYVAKWDGTSWSPFGAGPSCYVYALTVFDDGSTSGPTLYAGGASIAVGRVATWSGSSWSTIGNASGSSSAVRALTAFDDGSGGGPALYAGGEFFAMNGVTAGLIAKWDGVSWSSLGSGIGGPDTSTSVKALLAFDEAGGARSTLCVGGNFQGAVDSGDSYIAKWGCAPQVLGTPFCFGDGTGTACPCSNPAAAGEGCANGSGQGATLIASGSISVAAADLVLSGANLIPGQAGLYYQGDLQVNGGNGSAFGDGLRCAGTNVVRLQVVVADGSGESSTSIDLAAKGGVSAGDTRSYQLWYRDPASSPCGTGFNLSHGLELTWSP